jgi:putative ABC transport system substrate-binding protein
VEGQSIAIEDHWADGHIERFAGILAEVIQAKVDVIVQASTPGAIAAKKATTTVPVVFWGVIDPVGLRLVASLAHPGGNLTGLALDTEEGLPGKWVELSHETMPKVVRLGALWNRDSRPLEPRVAELGTSAARLGLTLHRSAVRTVDDLDGAIATLAKAHVGALIVLTDPMTLRNRERIVQLAARARLPAIYGFGEFVRAGGLMAYGPSVPDLARRAATYVDKILKGAKPGDLPVEQPTKFELVINLKTARALGLTIAPSLLQRADQVIE